MTAITLKSSGLLLENLAFEPESLEFWLPGPKLYFNVYYDVGNALLMVFDIDRGRVTIHKSGMVWAFNGHSDGLSVAKFDPEESGVKLVITQEGDYRIGKHCRRIFDSGLPINAMKRTVHHEEILTTIRKKANEDGPHPSKSDSLGTDIIAGISITAMIILLVTSVCLGSCWAYRRAKLKRNGPSERPRPMTEIKTGENEYYGVADVPTKFDAVMHENDYYRT